MISAGVQPALDSLMATGNFTPTLYIHDGEQFVFVTMLMKGLEEVHAACRLTIQQKMPDAVAYVLLYDSSVETEDGPADVLIIETGDIDEEEAHEFARKYSRQEGTIAPKMVRLGAASHLLKDETTS